MTKQWATGAGLALMAVTFVGAQEPAPAVRIAVMEPQPAMARSTVVETRITTGRPYSAEATTEFTQMLGDGNRIARKATVRIYRDSDGRTRREELGADGSVKLVSIFDPVAHVSYVLDPARRIARKSAMRVALPAKMGMTDEDKQKIEAKLRELESAQRAVGKIELVAPSEAPAPGTALPEEARRRQVEMAAVAARGRGVLQPGVKQDANEESLGQKVIEGVLADGKRVTTVIPAGAIGNQQAITVRSEQWFSPDLEILLMTRHSDPRSGETSYTLSNVTRGEPAANLFDVPPDYAVQDSSYMRSPAVR
jgi:hypothetical protein